jgi:proteic killer suppression protein
MIESFGDRAIEDIYHSKATSRTRRFRAEGIPSALRKFDMLDAAHRLDDLKAPPGNRLEALRGKGQGYHSIRVNNRWRIVFKWTGGGAYDVSLADYHYMG